MTVHVFAGPSISVAEIASEAPDAVAHPPVGHGDLLRLGLRPGDTAVIVDGYYHQAAPVRHKEILQLIDSGVVVVGCASMGALRAAELHQVGMVGTGVVFGMYRDGEIDADDEVAVAHLQAEGFTSMSIPLVNIRVAVRAAARAGRVSDRAADEVIEAARALHYTDRRWQTIGASLASRDGGAETVRAVQAFLDEHPEHADAKRRDALETLRRIATITREAPRGVADESWRNELIYSWLVEFEGRTVKDRWVCDGAVLRHQQLYSPDFPTTWEQFALVSLGDQVDALRIPSADVVAAHVPEHHLRTESSDDDVARRICVRAFKPVRGLHDLRAFAPGLVEDSEAQQAVAEASELNDTILWRPQVRLVDRLGTPRLEEHLRDVWQVSGGDAAALLAAARDRGFPTVADATAAARQFFLWHDRRAGGRISARGARS